MADETTAMKRALASVEEATTAAQGGTAGSIQEEGYFSETHKIVQITLMTLSWAFAVASLILCAVWGSRGGKQYLNIPSWKSNVFAWHPILLVCGFFFSQVFSLTTAGVFPKLTLEGSLQGWAWLYHAMWQFCAIATLVAGLMAAFKDYNNLNLPNLTSVHSWMGIVTAVLFFLYFVLLGVSALSAFIFTEEPYIMRGIRSLVRLSAFVMTAVSIGSGIMIFQGETGCFYPLSIINAGTPDYDPAEHYDQIPAGCQISNGLALTVIFGTLFTIAFIAVRYEQLILMLAVREPTAAMVFKQSTLERGTHRDTLGEKESTSGVTARPLTAAGAVL